MVTKAPNLKQQAVCPPSPQFQSVIMKTTRMHSATDVVTDNHIISDFKYCSSYWTLGARLFVCCNFVEKLGRKVGVILLLLKCCVTYKHRSQDLIVVSQSGYNMRHMTEEYWFDSRKSRHIFPFCKVSTLDLGGPPQPSKR